MGKRAWKQLLSLMGPKVWLLSCVYVGKFGSFSSVEISFNAHPSLWQTGNKKRSNEKKTKKGERTFWKVWQVERGERSGGGALF